MVSYDDQTVIRLISELKKAVGRLKALSQLDLQSFLKDPDKAGIVWSISTRRWMTPPSTISSAPVWAIFKPCLTHCPDLSNRR